MVGIFLRGLPDIILWSGSLSRRAYSYPWDLTPPRLADLKE